MAEENKSNAAKSSQTDQPEPSERKKPKAADILPDMPPTTSESAASDTSDADESDAGDPDAENLPAHQDKAIVTRTIRALQNEDLTLEDSIVVSDESLGVVRKSETPWTLQQYFNGEVDLAVELGNRFSSTPLMSTVKFRTLGSRTGRGVATLATSDGSAEMIVDADSQSKIVQISFTYGSMITLRFVLNDLVDRTRWLELMRREEGGLAFLWGPPRWEEDYVICIARRYYTNFYAFSPNGFEAAARMTPEVTNKLLDWLDGYWRDDDDTDEAPPQMLTW